MDKQFSNKQKGYWGAANTNNSTSSYAAGMSQWSWPQTTANTTQGYGSTSNDGAKLTAEQWAAMSMYYAAQKKVAETSAQTFEGYSTSAVGGLYGTSATTNLYARTSNQRTMSGYNTGTSYYGTQNTSQQKPVQGYSTANQQMTNKLYGGINTNMTGSFGELSEATKGYENLGMSYGASSDKFSEGSMTGTSSMPYGGSMRSSGASRGFAGPIQSSENKKMLLEGAQRAGNNTPYGEASRAGGRLGSSDQPPGTYVPRSSTVASKGRFYGTDRETPLEVIDLRDDSDGEHEQMPKRQATMGYRRLSPEQDEFTGPRQRYADKDTYVGNKASVSFNRYYDEPQLKNNENRSSWNKTDSSYNRDEWRHHDYKSADTNRSTDASMDRSAWHQKDDIRNPFEAEESKLSWNRYGSSYDEESGASSKNRDLYDRNEDGRSWKERDTSFNKGARNDPGDFYSRDERGRIWKQQGMEEDITSQRKRKNMEEERPLWKRRPMGEEHISPWKKQAFEEEKMAPLRRQDLEEDTMPPWKKKVMERKMLEGRAMQGWMSTSKNPRLRCGEENVSSSLGAIEGSLPPWKRRIEEKMAPPWSRERNEEKVPPWKKKNAPTPNKKKGRFLSKKQKGKARKKNKKKLREEKFFQRKGQKEAVSDSEEDPTPTILDGIAMMICDKRYPVVGLKENHSKIIMDDLLRAMQNLAFNESPQFSTHKFMRSGMLSIICANERTCDWLKKKVETLKAPWEGADLIVKPFRVPVIIHIPGAEESEHEVKEELQKANVHFKVHEWELMKKENLNFRVEYTYLIDYNTFEALKAIQFRPYYKKTRVFAKMVHSDFKQKTVEGSEQAVDNDEKEDARPTEAEVLLKEATQMNKTELENSNRNELEDAELSEAEILLRQIEQGEK